MWEPRRLTTLRASTACYRDSIIINFTTLRKLEGDNCFLRQKPSGENTGKSTAESL
jgi:hypothetical protein